MQNNGFKHIKQKLFNIVSVIFFYASATILSGIVFPLSLWAYERNETFSGFHTISNESLPQTGQVKTFPIFGKKYEKVTIVSNKLKGTVFYLVSGHGGPDPGAIGKYNNKLLCEDEYAYDITLRLAKELLSHSAMVYIIVRDPNDGIRDDWYLPADQDEVCYPKLTIPLNQTKRLKQRKDAVNKLYQANKTKYRYHRMIEIHVDSRSTSQKTDVFFYYNKGSQAGKKLANNIRDTFDKKYQRHQPGRGYHGTVSERNLYMLKLTHPVALYIELGNINHQRDIQRLIITDNRQALANWLAEGCMLDYKSNR